MFVIVYQLVLLMIEIYFRNSSFLCIYLDVAHFDNVLRIIYMFIPKCWIINPCIFEIDDKPPLIPP